MNGLWLVIVSIIVLIAFGVEAQIFYFPKSKSINNDKRNLLENECDPKYFERKINTIESYELQAVDESPLLAMLNKNNGNSVVTNENRSKRIVNNWVIENPIQPNSITPAKLRLCEKKYAEYIKMVFPEEDDTAADANDSQFNGRVLADPGEYPHMCALGFRNNVNGKYVYKCGGSLISEQFVITAAHCADFNGEKPSRIRIGAVNLMTNNTKTLIGSVKKVHIHPTYKRNLNYNDIALLELKQEIVLSANVRPIRLWTSFDIAFKEAYAMGYGSTEFARAPTNRLTVLNMTIVPNEECDREMPVLPETKYGIIPSQICAQDYISNRDTCQGDSGGPLQLNLQGQRRHNRLHYHLIGITSYGLFCRSGYPSVFTRVQYYLDWIEQIVWKELY